MEQPVKKRRFLSPRIGTLLGILVIAIAVVATLIKGPSEPAKSSLFGAPIEPTVEITELAGTLNVQQQVVYKGVQVKFTKAMIAKKFSDGRRRSGPYTVRVLLETSNHNKSMVGVEYAKLIQLVVPGGKKIDSNLVSIHAVEVPGQSRKGFIDFPVDEKYDLKTLAVNFDKTELPLGAQS